MKRIGLLLTGLIVFSGLAGAQDVDMGSNLLIETNKTSAIDINYAVCRTVIEIIWDYQGHFMSYYKTPYYEGKVLKDPIAIIIYRNVNRSVNVIYSLYTFKNTFFQSDYPDYPDSNQRGYLNGIRMCDLGKKLSTQKEIDENLDKIYEFPVITETPSEYRILNWDGKTDPKYTGQNEAMNIRDCVYLVAYDAESGEILGASPGTTVQAYRSLSFPGISYIIDKNKDGIETVSAEIIIGYDDIHRGPPKITAAIMLESCGFGRLSYEVINKGAEAMVVDINKRVPGEVVAHTELTNPTVDSDNPYLKKFFWKHIRDEYGNFFYPDTVKYYLGYEMFLIFETDEMTYTGVKNGYISEYSEYVIIPTPGSTTGINQNILSSIQINSTSSHFIIHCPANTSAQSYTIYDLSGRTLKSGRLSGASEETISAVELRNGIYFVQVTVIENGEERIVTKKVIKK